MQAHVTQKLNGVFVAFVLLATMFVPLVAIHLYGATAEGFEKSAGGEVTVGIAVILRATARRLLRGASSSLMRTTAGALGRTSARALTRRFVKFTGRLFFSSIVQESTKVADKGELAPATLASQLVALGIGFVALCLSFLGILHVASPDVVDHIMGTTSLGTLDVVLLAGLPLLVYAGLHQVFGRACGVRVRYRTEIDGLLLQAYFTGAGSFLPLTTDVDYTGSERAKRTMAIGSILGLFAIHLVAVFAGRWLGSDRLEFLGFMLLIYSFVYCFPIKPLEGHFIWATSKLQWGLVTLPILVAFLSWLPPAFGEIL